MAEAEMQDVSADTATKGSPQLLVQTINLLQARDDTSRFVGLSLLRSLLDLSEKLRNDPELVSKFWDALPARFLTRLLKTSTSLEKGKPEDAKRLNEIAIAVIHTFVSLLPKSTILRDQKLTALCTHIADAISRLNPALRTRAFQILQALANEESNLQLVGDALEPWQRLTGEDEAALREYGRLIQIMRNIKGRTGQQLDYIDGLAAEMVSHNKLANRKQLFEVVSTIYQDTGITHAVLAERIITAIQETILVSKPNPSTIRSIVNLAAIFVHHPSPVTNLNILLLTKPKSLPHDPEKPFIIIFPTLLTIEIRSTLPSLLEHLASPTYPQTALHMANAYDLLTAFTAFLITTLSTILDSGPSTPLPFPPSALLSLRTTISPTLSQTTEFLRDRYDAARTGAPGLDAATRHDLRITSDTVRALTWDNPGFAVFEDPIVVSGLRCLGLWIREDEEGGLRGEVAALMDVLVDLFAGSDEAESEAGRWETLKVSICVIFAVLFGAEEGDEEVERFLGLGGWDLLARELYDCFEERGRGGSAERTQDVVQVLIRVVESDAVPATREAWMDLVKVLATVPLPLSGSREKENQVEEPEEMDGQMEKGDQAEGKGKWKAKLVKVDGDRNETVHILEKLQANTAAERLGLDCENLVAAYQLAVALVVKAPPRLKRVFQDDWKKIKENAEEMLEFGVSNDKALQQGTMDGLKEVIEGLESVESS